MDYTEEELLEFIERHDEHGDYYRAQLAELRGNKTPCKHCGQPITDTDWATHLEGNYRGKMRCDPEDSGLRYGYNAEPFGSGCKSPCVGSVR